MDYVSVILPLKLAWVPVYEVPEALRGVISRGDRVKVPLAGRTEDGVVLDEEKAPADPARIKSLIGLVPGLERISPEELELWRFVAEYYMCSIGEVLKCAYPSGRVKSEEKGTGKRARKTVSLSPELTKEAFAPSQEDSPAIGKFGAALKKSGTVLLRGAADERYPIYRSLIRKALSQGGSVLLLVPEVAMGKDLAKKMEKEFSGCVLQFSSSTTVAQKRDMAALARKGGPLLIVGTRSSIFLPFKDLSLIIVDSEQDRSYKQDSPAPRYNARDCASVLGRIHSCPVLLGSDCPSLETIYNCTTGRYASMGQEELSPVRDSRLRIIDTAQERRKNGMRGQLSIKLEEMISETLADGNAVCLLRIWGDVAPTVEEVAGRFPDVEVSALETSTKSLEGGRIYVGNIAMTRSLSFPEGTLLAMLQADPMFGMGDYRADERSLQMLRRYLSHCREGLFVIQTSRSEHPLFESLQKGEDPSTGMLEERKIFAYPPYTRIIDLVLKDPSEKRRSFLAEELYRGLSAPGRSKGIVSISAPSHDGQDETAIRLIIEKGKGATQLKHQLYAAVLDFERTRKYPGHIKIDVDPD